MVEDDTAYWVGHIGQFCPWNSFVEREVNPNHVNKGTDINIKVYPNPLENGESITLSNLHNTRNIAINYLLNSMGQIVKNYRKTANPRETVKLNSEDLSSGNYFLILKYRNKIHIQKIIIQ